MQQNCLRDIFLVLHLLWQGDEHEQCNLQCKEEDEESTEYSVESIGDGEDSQDYVEDDEDIDGEEDWEEDVIHNRRIVEEED